MSKLIQQHEERMQHRRKAIKSYRTMADAKRTMSDKFADFLTSKFGTVTFLAANAIWFVIWILLNGNIIAESEPFDPFPFGLLTMLVSLEAIFLAIIVLISQNRAAKVAEVREEIDLQINTITEGETTKAITLLIMLLEKNGVSLKDDPELAEMIRPLKNDEIQKILEDQLR